MEKRINKEFSDLKLIYPNVGFNLTKISDKEYDLQCDFPDNKLNIKLDDFYPFKAPKITINDDDFFNTIRNSDQNMTKKIYGFDCFCCESYLCSKNWAPSIRLDQVIDQSFDLINKKKSLNNIKLDEISQQKQGANNYVPGRFSISFGPGNQACPAGPESNKELDNIDPNYSFLKELYEANEQDDFLKYQEIYNQFINDPTIYCFHSYTEHPAGPCERQFYPLCSCANTDENIAEDSLLKIHRGLYELPCNCSNGKRYFALRNAYEIAYKKISGEVGCFITFSIKDLIDRNRTNNQIRSQIIDWVELDGPIDKSYVEWI
jgi:hypothetical protein